MSGFALSLEGVASIDFGASTDFASHLALTTQNVPAFENLTRLEELPAVGAYVVALPMKIKGAVGARCESWPRFRTRIDEQDRCGMDSASAIAPDRIAAE